MRVHTDLGERRAIAVLLVLTGEDRGDPISARRWIEGEACPGQRNERPFRQAQISPLDVGMLNDQLGDHLGNHIIEIGAMPDMVDQRFIFAAQLFPVIAVHVRDVKIVPVAPPNLAKNLVPLLGRDARGQQAGQ